MIQPIEHQLLLGRFRKFFLIIALIPFVSIPLLGSQLYFRHDDSAMLLWAKEFNQPFYYAFSTDPEINRFADYPGMGAYWRPVSRVYIMALWNIFGPNPAPYYLIGGLLFVAAVYLFFRLVKQHSTDSIALLSCLTLFVVFHNTMYNLFHIAVPQSFFFQMGMLYFFFCYLKQQRWYNFAGMLLFLVPAMSRQTTPILLTAILITTSIEQYKSQKLSIKNIFPVLGILIAGFFIIRLSPQTSEGSVLSAFPEVSEIFNFLSERFFYYGTILTSGVTGIVMLLLIGGGVLQHIANRVKSKFHFDQADWIWPLAAFLLTLVLMRLQPLAVYWLVFCCVYVFVFDPELRMPIGWAGASLLSFLCARYYHNGYLLEAGFPFALVLAILISRFVKPVARELREHAYAHVKRNLLFACGAVLLLIPSIIYISGKTPILSERIEVIKIAIDSNKNYGELMSYLQHELPENAIVYELSEQEVGTTRFDRRFLPLRERAKRVKLMSIEDKLVMLRVLDRDDIRIYPASQLDELDSSIPTFFIALNEYEREIAETRVKLAVIKEFRRSHDSAAIYRIVRNF